MTSAVTPTMSVWPQQEMTLQCRLYKTKTMSSQTCVFLALFPKRMQRKTSTSGQVRARCGYESSLLSRLHSIVICLSAPGQVVNYRAILGWPQQIMWVNVNCRLWCQQSFHSEDLMQRMNVSPRLQRREKQEKNEEKEADGSRAFIFNCTVTEIFEFEKCLLYFCFFKNVTFKVWTQKVHSLSWALAAIMIMFCYVNYGGFYCFSRRTPSY